MNQKRRKRIEMLFVGYLDEGESLVWVGEPQSNRPLFPFLSDFGNIAVSWLILIFSIFALFIFLQKFPVLAFMPMIMLIASLIMVASPGFPKRYYAISNKRLFTLNGSELSTEIFPHIQQLRIEEDSNLYFAPATVVYGPEQGMNQDYPLHFAEKRLEGLSKEDAETAYKLLNAEKKEQTEILDLPQ